MDCYIRGARAGDADLMHSEATISGYCQGVEYGGSIQHVFDWITANGPAPHIQARFARIEIIESIAPVHLEVQGWSDKLVGVNKRASDVFSLLKLKVSGRSLTSCSTGMMIELLRRRLDHLAGPTTRKRLSCVVEK